MMKKTIQIIMILFLLTGNSWWQQILAAPSFMSPPCDIGSPVTTISTVNVCSGATTVDIPVNVTSFNTVGSISLKLAYNPSELGTAVLLSSNPALWQNFIVSTETPGAIIVSGYGTGFSLDENATLFTLRFTSPAGLTNGAIVFVENAQGTSCEYSSAPPPDYTPYCDTPQDEYYVAGGITVIPNPILVITNPQPVCSPGRVDLTAPAVTEGSILYGATLSYWLNADASLPMSNPTTAGNGTYYIKATSLAGGFDIKPVVVTVFPLPRTYIVTGGGSYCAGGTGLIVGLNGSQLGVNYTLWHGYTLVSSIIHGTGSPISFGLRTVSGYYWVLAENTTTHCTNWMYNFVQISIDSQLPVSVSVIPSENPVLADSIVTFTATPVNGGTTPTYQWIVNGLNVGTNSATFIYVPVNEDEVTCVLTSNAYCVSGNPATSNTVIMEVEGVPANINITGIIFNGKDRCYNALQTLWVAGNGTTFTIQNGGSATMIAGQNIIYLPGTTILAGGYMHGSISDDYCGLKSSSASTAETVEYVLPATSQRSSFIVYPNPTTGKFTIEQTGGKFYGNIKIEVYGMRGEILMTGALNGEKKHEFQTSGLPDGLYFVKAVTDESVDTFKLIKTR